jgi:hypothetical protein
MFLLVYNSYAGGFIVTFPYMYTKYPIWFIPLLFSLFLLKLLEMTLTGFSALYSYMYRKHMDHFYPPLCSSFHCYHHPGLSRGDLLCTPPVYLAWISPLLSLEFFLIFYSSREYDMMK